MDRKIFILFGLLISFQIVDIFLVNDLPLELAMNSDVKIFPNFETVDLNGKTVTEQIFDNKITALVLWTTRDENSPDLLKNLNAVKDLPKNVQIICLAGDANLNDADTLQKAKNIAETYAPSIKCLAVNDDFYPVLSKIKTAPTTIFVDEHRNLIGQPAGGDLKFILRELNFILERDSPRSQSLRTIQNFIFNR